MKAVRRAFVSDERQEQYSKNFKSDKNLQRHTVRNGYIFPALPIEKEDPFNAAYGVWDENLNYVDASAMIPGKIRQTPCNVKSGQIEFINEKVIYCGVAYFFQYGHFLIESTTRLWYPLKTSEEELKLVFINVGEVGKYADFFELLGIELERIIFVDKPLQFKEIIIPDVSSIICEWYTDEFMIPFRKASENVSAGLIEKVYLTRKYLPDEKYVGEKTIEDIFIKNGYTVLAPEKLTLKEQVSLMKGAKSIVSLFGSATHNCVFASPGTELIILNRARVLPASQMVLNQASKMDYYCVDVYFYCLPLCFRHLRNLLGQTPFLKSFLKAKGMHYDRQEIRISRNEVHDFLEEWFYLMAHKEVYESVEYDFPEFCYQMPLSDIQLISKILRHKKNKKKLRLKKWAYFLCCLRVFVSTRRQKETLRFKQKVLEEKIKLLEKEAIL